jgi:malate/lactate dehydrogenase
VSTIVVLGAGPIGAATAFQLASRGVAGRVVLVDAATSAAQGLALDMQQAGTVTGSPTRLEGTSDVAAVIGAAVIVVADRHGGAGEWAGDDGLSLVSAARGMNARALVICAGATHGPVIETLVLERNADRRRTIGTAPEALRQGMRTLTALAADVAAGDVSLAVLGRPPRHLFVAWSGASIAGSLATELLAAPDVVRLDAQAAKLWPPGPLALGCAAAEVAGGYLTSAPGVVNVLLVPPDDHQVRRRCLSVPATLGSSGARPRWPVVAPRDQLRLDGAGQT